MGEDQLGSLKGLVTICRRYGSDEGLVKALQIFFFFVGGEQSFAKAELCTNRLRVIDDFSE